ncbi:membrane protein, partial [Rhodococcus rhodochrous]
MTDVLALVDDPALMASLRRVAAASDRTVGETATPPPRRTWLDAGLVVIDRTAALACAQQLPRRGGIVLVTVGGADLPDWQAATAVGAEHVVGLPDDEVELLTVLGAAAE